MSMTLDLLKQRRLERRSKNKYQTKKIDSEVLIELKNLLSEYLKDNDSIMVEVNPKVVSSFISAKDTLEPIYKCIQLESTLYIFKNREIL